MAAHGVDGLLYGHFGDGCIHARIDFPLRDRPSVLRSFTQDAARLAASYGGSMSGEHGDGRARGELLPAMYSAAAIGLFGAVKQLFDPANLLNPGVIVDPAPLDADLRVPLAPPLRRTSAFAYAADGGDFSSAVHRCTGVGKCRADNTASGGVMCPSYLATKDEKDSTRGRARVLQELANGSLVSSGWQSPEVAEALDLCLSCKGCSTDCPAGVDMATYKAEALHQRYRGKLRPASHYALGWLPRWAALTSRAPVDGEAGQRRPAVRACGRPRQAPRRHRRAPGPARVRDPELPPAGSPSATPRPRERARDHRGSQARAAVGGHVHQRVRAAGRPGRRRGPRGGRLSGPRHRAQRLLRPHLDLDRPAGRGQAAAQADARRARPGPRRGHPGRRARAVLHGRAPRRRGRAAAGRPARGGARAAPCRPWPSCSPPPTAGPRPTCPTSPGSPSRTATSTRSSAGTPTAALLATAGAKITAVGGCCGLAGNFGVERGHYDVSVAVAETALLPAVRAGRKRRATTSTAPRDPGRRLLLPHPARPAGPTSTASTWPSCWPSAWRRQDRERNELAKHRRRRPAASSGCR